MFLEIIQTSPTVISADMLLFVTLLFAFGLLIYGHMSKLRIFNLFSIGLFLFLGIQLIDYLAVVVVIVGLIIYEIYYTFFGGN